MKRRVIERGESPYFLVEDLHFKYPRSGFSLSVKRVEYTPGKIFAILGPNGSGKTTYLRLLTGFLTPDQGKVFFRSRPMSPTLKLLDVFIPPYEESHKTLNELIYQYSIFREEDGNTIKRKALVLVKRLGFDESIMDKLIVKLSSGEQKSMFNILGLALDTKVLIVDEPFAEIDPKRGMIFTTIFEERSHNSDKTTILTAHELGLLDQFSNLKIDFFFNGCLMSRLDSTDVRKGIVVIKKANGIPRSIKKIMSVGSTVVILGGEYEKLNKAKYHGEFIYDLNQLSKLYFLGE
jgi:ABC-type multidrug transport system ATPase subunit